MPVHRDAEGNRIVGGNWESVTERLIREAQERGEFSHLPLHGKPLPDTRNPYAGDWELAYGMLKNAHVAPAWIESDKEVRSMRDRRDALLDLARRSGPLAASRLERELQAVVVAHNRAVEAVNAEAPGTRQHRRPMDLEAELRALREALSAEDDPMPPGGPAQ
jgi:hypothetical protein